MKNKVYMLLNRHIALITTIVDLLYIGLLFFSSCASLTSPATLNCFLIVLTTTLIISKKPGNTGISRDIRTEFTTDLLLSD